MLTLYTCHLKKTRTEVATRNACPASLGESRTIFIETGIFIHYNMCMTEKVRIDFTDENGLWETVVSLMEQWDQRFSVLLDTRSDIFAEPMSWMRFRARLIHDGKQVLLGEIEQLERYMVTDKIERELYESYNSGDKDGVEICVKTLNGIIAKSKLGLSKLDSDRKLAETRMRFKKETEGLEKYDTNKLEAMLEAIKNGNNASGH